MASTYKESQDPEFQSLLPHDPEQPLSPQRPTRRSFHTRHVALAYVAGILSAVLVELFLCNHLALPLFPSPAVHRFPPSAPTNAFPSLFPTDVGYAGPTPTGAEPALIATAPAYPLHTGAPHLVSPLILTKNASQQSGSSVERASFGIDSGPEAPPTCRVTGLHLLHRHGARYPTEWASYGGPANFSGRLHAAAAGWNGSGDLQFMNDWTYKLGEEILTPFGRQQLFDLGVSMRMKYGFLLKNFTDSNTIPVFRTESQDRMLSSALNFALGFFGYPFDGQYQQSITIEENGFNNTLAPYKTCPNAGDRSKADRGTAYDALARLKPQLHGYELTIEDVYTLQQTCAYETVAIGYSKFCELFTEEEWKGFNYALDLYFWYDSAFGSPLLARLTHTPIPVHNSSTNATLDDNQTTFPLGQSLYVDATHEVVVLNVITALNLSNFAADGPLPFDHIPPNRAFKSSHLAPFATNIQFQLLSCESLPDPQIRVIINDGVAPLTGIRGCPEDADGKCPVPAFVAAQREIVADTDWNWACHGDWAVPPGTVWNTTTGDAPKPASASA
ncbi:phosphoglycerate mutase-like protein [Epithele typhae]|uniref:phosphoglycerate mutase-like protein n=1 Tax=Epithele typhae TaxID=378194 RepID=UPI0020075303|nr:phosphoglycerate mutase-like protein [Epithele typhae]KAH9927417.1 phosphoglycerate mutase-like protein [Epithele typhae]